MRKTYNCVDEMPLSLTVDDVAGILGISKNNVYALCHSNDFPSVQVGRRWVIPKLAFVKWMENPKSH